MEKLAISKTAASGAVPFTKSPTPEPAQRTVPAGGQKSLTVKLDADDYWALRDYCAQQERKTGQRVTHQQVLVMGLRELLNRRAAA